MRNRAILVALILLSCIGAFLGTHFAGLGLFDYQHNQFFDADPNRVVYNATHFIGPYQRARLHPLHVLIMAPLAEPLSRLLGSPTTAVSALSALLAGGVLINVNHILSAKLGLPLRERFLFLGLLGLSASQVTFTAVPDTHILSALGLSGMAREMAPELGAPSSPGSERLRLFRALGWATFAIGMLATNIVIVAWFAFLSMPVRRGLVRRALYAIASTIAVLGVVGALYGTQVAIWPANRSDVESKAADEVMRERQRAASKLSNDPFQKDWLPQIEAYAPPPAAPDNETQAIPSTASRPARLANYLKEQIRYNAGYLTPLDKLPARFAQVLLALFVNDFFSPAFHVYHRWYPPATIATVASFEPVALQHRFFGGLGAILWLGSCAALLYLQFDKRPPDSRLVSADESLAETQTDPSLAHYLIGVIVFYATLVWLYGDELFLYSPNWAFAVILLVAFGYRRMLTKNPSVATRFRFAWLLALACLAINTVEHVRDLVQLYSYPV